ncbi:hypothetical protein P4482_09110 [Neobacillus thermocopriae]|uniref:hypothetical protein n=1 Tax=Neobacillus thermocopriae TaxID=1215031 RepID=UPI002E24B7C2|nr:hypothetical protein [Neobacillus thermocopriae]MED3714377.1 hypothetical protein [Neobacillus thermocopriae]
MRFEWVGVNPLARKLIQKSATDFKEVAEKNIRDIYTRSQKPGGTPVGDYTGGGQLRKSAQYRSDEMGYTAHYSAHVEYGHRLVRGGRTIGFVPGQFYLKKNVDTQRPIYKEDLRKKLRE